MEGSRALSHDKSAAMAPAPTPASNADSRSWNADSSCAAPFQPNGPFASLPREAKADVIDVLNSLLDAVVHAEVPATREPRATAPDTSTTLPP